MFSGSMVALVTPFKKDKVDEAALRKLVDWQVQSGTNVLVPCGTTGESATLTFEEHIRVIKIVVEQAGKKVKILAGAGANATHEAVDLTKASEKAGADGTLQVTPYYNKPTQEGLFRHFKAIAEASPLPVVLYNVPGRTALNMLPETMARLAEIENIVGIKEAAGNLEQVEKLVNLCPKNFAVISGEDALNHEIKLKGGVGSISVTANIVPRESAEQWRMYSEGKVEEGKKVHEKLMPLHRAMFLETNPIPVKAALSLMGKIEEEYRLPLTPISEENREKLRRALKEYGLI
ncbi:MAG: 4-hydroxy-tetrahydrodipicolinate synthase [Deltaproteobacteria bacterium]|nr:4-hydroxy-tetrahydrodipicolinate synthase [Deltaproteobacteria bacterium]